MSPRIIEGLVQINIDLCRGDLGLAVSCALSNDILRFKIDKIGLKVIEISQIIDFEGPEHPMGTCEGIILIIDTEVSQNKLNTIKKLEN